MDAREHDDTHDVTSFGGGARISIKRDRKHATPMLQETSVDDAFNSTGKSSCNTFWKKAKNSGSLVPYSRFDKSLRICERMAAERHAFGVKELLMRQRKVLLSVALGGELSVDSLLWRIERLEADLNSSTRLGFSSTERNKGVDQGPKELQAGFSTHETDLNSSTRLGFTSTERNKGVDQGPKELQAGLSTHSQGDGCKTATTVLKESTARVEKLRERLSLLLKSLQNSSAVTPLLPDSSVKNSPDPLLPDSSVKNSPDPLLPDSSVKNSPDPLLPDSSVKNPPDFPSASQPKRKAGEFKDGSGGNPASARRFGPGGDQGAALPSSNEMDFEVGVNGKVTPVKESTLKSSRSDKIRFLHTELESFDAKLLAAEATSGSQLELEPSKPHDSFVDELSSTIPEEEFQQMLVSLHDTIGEVENNMATRHR